MNNNFDVIYMLQTHDGYYSIRVCLNIYFKASYKDTWMLEDWKAPIIYSLEMKWWYEAEGSQVHRQTMQED